MIELVVLLVVDQAPAFLLGNHDLASGALPMMIIKILVSSLPVVLLLQQALGIFFRHVRTNNNVEEPVDHHSDYHHGALLLLASSNKEMFWLGSGLVLVLVVPLVAS